MQILTQVKYFSAVLANKIPKKIFFFLNERYNDDN